MDSISIHKLSKQALKKLEKGLPVRVKAGDGHTLELSSSKVAKLKKAFDKAKGMTLRLDEEEVAKSLGAGLFAGGGLYAQSSPTMRGRGKKSAQKAAKKVLDIRKKAAEKVFDLTQPVFLGAGTRLVDQKFSLRDVGNFTTKEIPAIFGGGGQLHRNRKDLLIEKGSIGVGGNLISPFEQPVAMRSNPYSVTFRQASQLPGEYKILHTGVV